MKRAAYARVMLARGIYLALVASARHDRLRLRKGRHA